MRELETSDARSREMISDLLRGSLGRVVRSAVASVVAGRGVDVEALAEDVLSDLALRILTGAFSGFASERASIETYVAAAARNKALDILRRSRRRMASLDDLVEDGLEPAGVGPAHPEPCEAAMAEERRLAVADALAALEATDPTGSEILEGRYLDGLSYPEIALRVGIPSVQALHLRAHRARRALRRLVAEYAE